MNSFSPNNVLCVLELGYTLCKMRTVRAVIFLVNSSRLIILLMTQNDRLFWSIINRNFVHCAKNNPF